MNMIHLYEEDSLESRMRNLLYEVRMRVSEVDLCSWCGCYEPETVRSGPYKMFHTPECLISRFDALLSEG